MRLRNLSGIAEPVPRDPIEGEETFRRIVEALRDGVEGQDTGEALRFTQFLVDRAADAAFWAHPDGHFFYANEAACAQLGYTREEILTLSVPDIVPPELSDIFPRVSQQVREEGPLTFESVERRKNGELFPVEVTLNRLEFKGREYFCAFTRDITERRRAEAAVRASEERYHSLFDGVPIGLYRTTPDDRFLDANTALVRILGYPSREALLQANVADIYCDPEDRRRWQSSLESESESQSFEARVRRYDGGVIWVRFRVQASRDEEGRIERYEGALEDITDRRRAEEALRASEERFRALVQNASDMIAIVDQEGTILYESPSHWRLLGIEPGEHLGRILPEIVHPDDRPLVEESLRQLVQAPGEALSIEYRLLDHNGTWRVVESTAANLLEHPAVSGIVLNAHDITDHKRAEARLLHDALHDELTGLPNRVLFMDRLQHALDRLKREPDRLTAVLFLDLDRFKLVNDSLGHLVGDGLLVQISDLLSTALRPTDTIARIGGDEFAILLDGGRDVSDAVRVAERIHDRLAEPINLGGHEVFVTASIGIAVCTPEYKQPEDVLRDADTAMYRAKSSGRACHVIFNRVMHRHVMARLQLETDLRRAIERNQLRVYYQPFVSVETGAVVGFEALVRWLHPRRGLMPPDEFIPAAEETGLIVPIGRFVLRESCRQIRELQRKHPQAGPLKLSVNLSNKQFFQADLMDHIQEALSTSGLAPSCLGLEITEGVIIRQAETAGTRFGLLKGMGVQLYLDDFGKGYSSLNYLHRLPLDILKIDRSFISRLGEESGTDAIVQAIVTLAHQLGMKVVAEGIETPDHLEKVRALGCEYGQGFLFANALSADEAEKLLMAGRHVP
jgi:diguanylate cyclase (GGDEF)-like protein/PAS domain S-box-containing protein